MYRDMGEAKLPWDGELNQQFQQRWKEWGALISKELTIPRTLAPVHQPISAIALHAFDDASKSGVSSAVYAVVQQGEVKTQGLFARKPYDTSASAWPITLRLMSKRLLRTLARMKPHAGVIRLWPFIRLMQAENFDSSCPIV